MRRNAIDVEVIMIKMKELRVLMLTRKYGNYETYDDSEDWKLLYKENEK